jgi:tRNA A-37 threonylcarbamoyl transferase component Bud32
MPGFPTRPEGLTKEWLADKLGVSVNGFYVNPLGEGVGVIGLVCRVTLDSPDGPATVIAKFAATAEENREIANTYSMYLREYRFYSQLAENIPINSPRCYYSEYNHSTNEFVLLLEEIQGYRLGDQVTGCSIDEAQLVIESLAALHRSTWLVGDETEIDRHNSPAQIQGMTMGFDMGWPAVREKFPDIVTEEIFKLGMSLGIKVEPLLAKVCSAPHCLAHGDLRLDNVFFGENEIVLVDFQAICKSAPEHDLAYFVTQSLKPDVRNARDWVAIYHELLTSEDIEYTLEQCRARYQQCALYFLCYAAVICSALDLGNERGRMMGETLLGNAIDSIKELKAFDLLETL